MMPDESSFEETNYDSPDDWMSEADEQEPLDLTDYWELPEAGTSEEEDD